MVTEVDLAVEPIDTAVEPQPELKTPAPYCEGLVPGRIVRYVTPHGAQLVAIIVRVEDREQGLLNLLVLPDTQARWARMARGGSVYEKVRPGCTEAPIPDTWHFPDLGPP